MEPSGPSVAVGDVLAIGDPAITRKAVQVAKEKHLLTWDELADEGVTILNQEFAIAAGRAGYKTPDELLTAVKADGYRRVVESLNVKTVYRRHPWKVKDLKKFLDEDIGIVPRERVLYDRAGKLTDAGMSLVYSSLYHPARMAAKFTRVVPRNRFIDVTNTKTAIQEFNATTGH